jgi:hypothetical protein
MSKERLPERSGWKEGLEDPGVLPEWETADKEAVWDQLHARLGKNSRRDRLAWYWIAAASIIIILAGTTALYLEKRPARDSTRLHPEKDPALVHQGTHQGNQGNHQGNQGTYPAKNSEGPVAFRTEAARTIPAPRRRSPRPITPVRPEGADKLTTLSFPAAPLQADTLNGFARRTIVLKKALRVVHINELGNPQGGGSPSMARNPPPLFRIKWGNPSSSEDRARSNEDPDHSSNTNTSIKINISPQN